MKRHLLIGLSHSFENKGILVCFINEDKNWSYCKGVSYIRQTDISINKQNSFYLKKENLCDHLPLQSYLLLNADTLI